MSEKGMLGMSGQFERTQEDQGGEIYLPASSSRSMSVDA